MHVNRYEAARKCTCYSFSSLGQWNGKLPRDSSPSSASSFTHHRMFTSHPKNDHLTTQCDSPVRSHFVMFYVLPGMQQVPTYFRFSVSLRMQSHCCEFSFSPFFHRLCPFVFVWFDFWTWQQCFSLRWCWKGFFLIFVCILFRSSFATNIVKTKSVMKS